MDRCRVDAEDRDIKIVVKTEPALEVMGSEDQLSIAIGNLVENAVNYSPDGTRVAVASHPIGDLVEVTVSDQGVGIPRELAKGVFAAFRRLYTQDEYEGSGLGLTIVREVVEQHGGKIWIESEEGLGTSFHFTLPTTPRPKPGTRPS